MTWPPRARISGSAGGLVVVSDPPALPAAVAMTRRPPHRHTALRLLRRCSAIPLRQSGCEKFCALRAVEPAVPQVLAGPMDQLKITAVASPSRRPSSAAVVPVELGAETVGYLTASHCLGRDSTMIRRIVGFSAGLYLLFAVIGRFVEEMGAVRCGCASTCWCKRPVLSTFRWVFPWRHTLKPE